MGPKRNKEVPPPVGVALGYTLGPSTLRIAVLRKRGFLNLQRYADPMKPASFIRFLTLVVAATLVANFFTKAANTSNSKTRSDQTYGASYSEQRRVFVTHLARQNGPADTLIIGDSIVEQTDWSGVCGTIFAAGVGGARFRDIDPVLDSWLEEIKPKRIVLIIGQNYFANGDEYDAFRKAYGEILNRLEPYEVVLVGLTNSARGTRFLRKVAASNGLNFVEMPEGHRWPDGIHLTAEGSKRLAAAIDRGC